MPVVGGGGGGGGLQVMLPGSCALGALVALAVARFGIVVHAWRLVSACTTTVTDAPGAKSPKLQESVCAPGAPLIEHPAELVCQVTPPPAGSGSLSVTPKAGPAPVLLTTMVNVAVSPALIVCPSGVLTTRRPGGGGGLQVMLPGSCALGALVALAVARFSINVQAVKLVRRVHLDRRRRLLPPRCHQRCRSASACPPPQ